VLAHQGGWDEMLMVLVPIAVLVGLLALARRRADRLPQADIAGDTAADTEPESSGPPAESA
jgi:hypothetical protein